MNSLNKNYIIFLILFTVCLSLYSNTLHNDFIIDDIDLIVNNPYIKNIKFLPLLFVTDFFYFSFQGKSSYYRPLTMLTYSLDYHLWKLNPFGYHLTNIILQAAVACLFYIFIQRLFADRQIAIFSSLLFVIHPIYANPIAYISGRGDILAVLFILISITAFLKFLSHGNITLLSLSLISYSCALLSREHAILFPLLLLLLIGIYNNKKALIVKYDLLFIMVTCFYLLLRFEVGIGFPDSLKTTLPLKPWLINFIHIIKQYLLLFFIPTQLRLMRIIPFVKNMSFINIAALAVLIASIVLLVKKRITFKRQLLFLLLWFAVTILPLSKLMFYYPRQGLSMLEHWFYMPSLALCALLGYLFSRVYSTKKSISIMLFTAVCMFYTYNVLDSNSHWKDKQSFYDYSMSLSPSCDIIKFNRIVAFVENNNFDRAIKELSILLEEEPKAWDVYLEIGNIYFLKKDFNKALENYYKVLQIKPDSDLAYLNIGLTQIAMKEDQKAIDNLVKTLEINPNLWQGYFYLGNLCEGRKLHKEAIQYYEKAMELNPHFAKCYLNLGIAYANTGQFKKAIKIWKKSLNFTVDKNMVKAYIQKAQKLTTASYLSSP